MYIMSSSHYNYFVFPCHRDKRSLNLNRFNNDTLSQLHCSICSVFNKMKCWSYFKIKCIIMRIEQLLKEH